MRNFLAVPAILAGLALSGCTASTEAVGVLPRDPVPPPPSVSGRTAPRAAADARAGTATPRRTLSVPGRS
ncbi:hypothetical protein JKG68_01825 [Microvirga aerilata]|jgi:hypothetical protein|uniref:Uncharacterized protein n=1 Tax=Microvirga aerilata TaxID=670292 RepID=A0A936Z6S9_9HYPH|nr:hypothetical protein [Microvirga aerilata]MBL0402697.1 hypothetical protein [Microvirga aerilata]